MSAITIDKQHYKDLILLVDYLVWRNGGPVEIPDPMRVKALTKGCRATLIPRPDGTSLLKLMEYGATA